MSNKRILITGANGGIGLATAKELVQNGADVILACRNLVKATEAQAELQALNHAVKVDVIALDLNSLLSVKTAADLVKERYGSIDVLINNAGIFVKELNNTEDGYEQQFGVNYLGPFLLTQLLLPLLQQAEDGRIIHLSSISHWFGSIRPETFRQSSGKYHPLAAYGQSKLANLLFSNALARQLEGSTVTSNALHPGGVDSDIYRDLPKLQYAVLRHFLISTHRPAKLIEEMALGAEWANRNGQYASAHLPNWQSNQANDPQLADQLYKQSLQMVQAYLPSYDHH
ncbi:SDR family NAD(P)-dependent oxidoreductase [Acinetobacter pittii]|uniref:SDR family NAD(P)-dependent oxidoreductase n=1 Tax=Acinetobacter pittii TaxID=48296 RepID=UPI001EFD663A|nr:SDR family NAD(P)-dependent oxidoreductase [Acinetobacter pittii]MCG9491560.1 SDR family NAD(P)-dependent oxidoreductase [Acinetobacter pittii]